jgi:hypothetical protein
MPSACNTRDNRVTRRPQATSRPALDIKEYHVSRPLFVTLSTLVLTLVAYITLAQTAQADGALEVAYVRAH